MSNDGQRSGVRQKLSPVSLESHSSKLNQSRLFDSIQNASQAEEERTRKEEKGRKWALSWLFLTLTRLLSLLHVHPFSFTLSIVFSSGGRNCTHFMLRHNMDFCFWYWTHFLLNIVTTVCLKDQVRVIKYAKANCTFAQVSSLEIFHQGTLLFFPNVVMNFKVDLNYWRREVCDQNTEQSPDWNSLFLEHWKGDRSCQREG